MQLGSKTVLTVLFSLFQVAAPAIANADGNFITNSCLLLQGESSFYGKNFKKEKLNTHAANGKEFNPNAMTAASPTLPLGTKVKVTDRETGHAVIVTITDRGPARWTGRVLDLSYGAAKRLGMVQRGIASVKIERTSGACSRLAENLEDIENSQPVDSNESMQLADAMDANEKS